MYEHLQAGERSCSGFGLTAYHIPFTSDVVVEKQQKEVQIALPL